MTTSYIGRGDSIINSHSVGDYLIVEFWSKRADNIKDNRRERLFGIIISGERKGECYASLDEALAGCIALKHEGLNHHADRYFMKMIDAIKDVELEEAASNAH